MKRSLRIDELPEYALFGGLGPDALQLFIDMATQVELAEGEAVFGEGDAANAIYILVDGQLGVYKRKGSGEQAGEHRLAGLMPGDFFGEMGLIDMQPRAATVRAEAPSALLRWDRVALREVQVRDMKAYTLLIMNIARELSRRLRRADETIIAHG